MSAPRAHPTAGRGGMPDLLRSEARKVLSVKLWWAMGLGPLVIGIFAAALSLAILSNRTSADVGFDPGRGSLAGLYTTLAILIFFAALFGAINGAGEYRNTMSTTYLTAASRGQALLAKLIVTAGVGVFYAVVIELVTGPIVAVVSPGSFDGAVYGFLVAGVVIVVLWTVIGAAVGTLLGSTVGAALTVAFYLVPGEIILSLILTGVGAEEITRFLPENATTSVFTDIIAETDLDVLPWWVGILVLLGWTAVFCGGAWAVNRVRDIG